MANNFSSTAAKIAETALANVVVGGLGVATGVIAARWLGPEGRGELAAIQMWPSVLSTFAMLGMGEAVGYFCAKDPGDSRRYLVTAGLIALVAMPAFAGIGYLLMPRLLVTESPRIVGAARLYLLLIPIYACGLPYQLLRGNQRYRLWNVMRIVPGVIWLGILVAAVGIGTTDPVAITAAFLLLLAAVGPLLTRIVWKSSAGPATPSMAAAASLMKFGVPSVLATLPQVFNLRLDQMMVAAVVPARELGVYMVAVAWASCIPMLSNALGMVVSTQIAADASQTDRRRRFTQAIRGAAWMIAASVIVMGIGTPVGLTLMFGRVFQAAVIPAAILVAASGVNALNGVLEELLRGSGAPSATFWAESVAVMVGLPALVLLLPRAGLTGAALASLIGYLGATVVLIVQSRRVAGLRARDVLDLRALVSSIVASVSERALVLPVAPQD